MKIFLCLTLIALTGLKACEKQGTGPDSKWLNNIDALLDHNREKVTITQGVTGTLVMIEGNCMPIIDPGNSENPCLKYPVKRRLHIHEYTLQHETDHAGGGFHFNVETPLIATIQTDNEGFFQIDLAPGKYSIFIEEEDALYANLWHGDGGIQGFEVVQDAVHIIMLEISHSAYF